MLALFSQFLRPQADVLERAIMATTVGVTDAAWYSLIVLLITHRAFLDKLQKRAGLINKAFGVILILLALTVVLRAVLS
jgi:threonine/homoserine/homoserine lactone efflux protein